MRNLVILAAASAALVTTGCPKKGGDDKAAPETSAAKPATSAPAAAAKTAQNAAIVERVKAHVEGCTINVEAGQAYSCKPGISDATNKLIRDTKPDDFASTLAAISVSQEDPKMAAAAVAMFAEQFDNLGEEGKRKNATPAAVDATLNAFKTSAGNRSVRLSRPAAQLATLAKANDKLWAAIDAQSNKNAQNEAYRNVLTFGRLDAFPKIQEIAAKKEYADAALDSVRKMSKPTDAEKQAVCPWAEGFLGNEDPQVASSAGYDMVYCRGKYIDSLLTEAEKRLKAKEYKNPFAMVMREPCFQFAGALTPSSADATQCDKVYAFLEKAANDKNVDDATRGMALWNIYYQRRDVKTLKLMRKYEKNSNKEISKRAKEAIKSLTETYKLKG